ncbi:MAG: hypothetical protein JKX72_02995 [Robiginitomaculum sp.]|nr:hypothetical protein [Robiginitomaculum sp.]
MNIGLYNYLIGVSQSVLIGVVLLFISTSSFATEQDTEELFIGDYAQPDPEAKNLIAAGRVYYSTREYQKAEKLFRDAVEQEPLYWRGWNYLAMAMDETGQQRQAAHAFAKAIELKERCEEGLFFNCINSEVFEKEWQNLVYNAGMSFLNIGDYPQATIFLNQRRKMFKKNNSARQMTVEWLAIARFAESDVITAWKEYSEYFHGEPFPKFNQENLSTKAAKNAQKPPAGFYKLLRAGMTDLRFRARQSGHLYYEYFHAQNVARVEALKEKAIRTRFIPRPYESLASQEYLIALFLKTKISEGDVWRPANSKLSRTPGFVVHPALSRYAIETARLAEKAIDRKKYRKAEDLYRLALATDPWWLHGQINLAKLEFINYGKCGPEYALNFIEEMDGLQVGLKQYYIEQAYIRNELQSMQRMSQDIWAEAKQSGTTKLEGWCDIPGFSTIRPDIEVR